MASPKQEKGVIDDVYVSKPMADLPASVSTMT